MDTATADATTDPLPAIHAALAEYRQRLAYRRKHWAPERRGVGIVRLEQARFALADALGVGNLSIQAADALADALCESCGAQDAAPHAVAGVVFLICSGCCGRGGYSLPVKG